MEEEYNHQPVPQEELNGVSHFPNGEDLMITSVEMLRKPKHRYLITFGRYSMSVHEDVMIKYRMMKGSIFRKEELEEIVVADERQQAYVEALRFLERKPRTAQEITQRLNLKGMTADGIEKTIIRLQQERLVDDELYAKQWAEQRITRQKKGRMWVRQELRQKGIQTELIADALNEVSEEDEFQSAYTVGQKKWYQIKGDALERKRKTGAFLMRRGFTGEQVRKVINKLIAEDREAEEYLEEPEVFN
ncbi:RecX family transcriptional regulator [Paenibacillus sp. N3/727]|uniref:regulatory protein RecX n=1 Tax=Paenibacillus sp. N3/727 TaxID=2925845 RepID=UPI001F52DFB3|nr:RecX family transcriptional regulator [Paenibacillus sp. N3/727]UNK21335.1 RecX family transcriptional regulator [Paenibacillus sp. N3/727]